MNIFNRKTPWENRKSIYEYIKNEIDTNGSLKNMELPDDKEDDGTQLKFAAGAMEGILSHHAGGSDKDVKELAVLIDKISSNNKMKDKIEFYNAILDENVNSIIGNLISELIKLNSKITINTHDFAIFLAFESPDRNAVKTGISLLNVIGNKNHLEKIRILGEHEEFTMYCTNAFYNLSDDYEKELFNLAKRVHGWGRIEIVERLADTKNAEIKKWILTEGYKNDIMYEYLANIAAETGELKKELSNVVVDKEIILAASDIITALIQEGPCAGISAYEDSAEVISMYIKHTANKFDNVTYLLTFKDIYEYLIDEDFALEELACNGWTEENRKDIIQTLRNEMDNVKWREFMLYKLKDNGETEFYKIESSARILKIDITDLLLDKLEKEPLEVSIWYSVSEKLNDENIDDVLKIAYEVLPLEEIGTGADVILGLGQKYKYNNILNCILQFLSRFEGKGEGLIITALKSPVVSNRNLALRTLNMWDIKYISKEIKLTLEKAVNDEPKEDIKERMTELLNKL